MATTTCRGCRAPRRDPAVIGAELAELLVRVRAEVPALRRHELPPQAQPEMRENAIMGRWMAGLGAVLDVRLSLWPLVLELHESLCACCAAREARRRRKAEDTPPSAAAAAEVIGHA